MMTWTQQTCRCRTDRWGGILWGEGTCLAQGVAAQAQACVIVADSPAQDTQMTVHGAVHYAAEKGPRQLTRSVHCMLHVCMLAFQTDGIVI